MNTARTGFEATWTGYRLDLSAVATKPTVSYPRYKQINNDDNHIYSL